MGAGAPGTWRGGGGACPGCTRAKVAVKGSGGTDPARAPTSLSGPGRCDPVLTPPHSCRQASGLGRQGCFPAAPGQGQGKGRNAGAGREGGVRVGVSRCQELFTEANWGTSTAQHGPGAHVASSGAGSTPAPVSASFSKLPTLR